LLHSSPWPTWSTWWTSVFRASFVSCGIRLVTVALGPPSFSVTSLKLPLTVYMLAGILRLNSCSKCALESVHYMGKMCTSEYPYGRGERRLVINTKESAYTVDGKLVHSINISIVFVWYVVRTKA
jgi:hypothetical protein